MRKRLFFTFFLLSGISLFAQEKMYIHRSDNFTLGALISVTDSIFFSSDGATTYFQIGESIAQYPTTEIDSITFGANSNTISITYIGSEVFVINPLAFEGVSVFADGAYVTVNSGSISQDINYSLSGTTTDGMIKIYSQQPFTLMLNGVNITNPVGPAVNIQSGTSVSVDIMTGTSNQLTDGVTYAAAGDEDQKGVFFSETALTFAGSGALTINGYGTGKHGLSADDHISVNGGTISVTQALKDGIHANDGMDITGGTITVTATGDAIDGDAGNILISGGNITTLSDADDVKGISCDGTMLVTGGTLNLTVNGDQSKAMKSEMAMTLSGGSITIHTSGGAVLEASGSGFDPSYCAAIKCDESITISGAQIAITTTGIAGKGISSDTNLEISSGVINITSSGNGVRYTNSSGVLDAYVSTCLSTDGDVIITGGSVTTSNSGSGGKGLSVDGTLTIGSINSSPVINITTTGARIFISGSGNNAEYAEAKAVKSNGDVVISNGNITLNSADDGIKSETSIIFATAILNITNSVEGLEAPYITINSGEVYIKASDDCINTTFGYDGEQNDGSIMTFNGGYTVVNATGGDGLDSNGNIVVNNGTIIVHGPPSAPEVGMDYNGTCNVNGGFLVISGTNSNMTQAPNNTSAQYSVKAMSNTSLSSTTLFHLQNASGDNIVTFQPLRNYYSIVFSSADLLQGSTYSIYTGGSCTGTNNNGLYTGGTYSGGTFEKSFTISGKVTNVNF